MTLKPIARLWNCPSLGLIVLYPSGVIYTNQTGGHSCLQPKEEGVLVPLHFEPRPGEMGQARLLADYFFGPKWLGWCTSGIDEETADYLDQVLNQSTVTAFLSVDRSRLADSHDAWIYVSISDQPKEPPVTYGGGCEISRTESGAVWRDSDYAHLPIPGTAFQIFGFGPAKGVLTW